ncbi:MAG: guanylate kinase [Deltaproteobacteria bacterium]|nr:guanylate kinase [Deltaproteobacteria bacterium]MBW2047421.1 guanylate kinase [Deltaproteobacteria bacterium]MBW2110411.1 guanylate kinase [Deltaproteobacteria bacterium]MBW2355077.1 guanylate kinase [Deltaproteobacteria bacterium]HDZ89956.1 guanylate kinase [Deltaproteobacteria bacterium]
MSGQLFVISAPSGGGKSTILDALRQSVTGLAYSISHTTRRPRGNERHGKDYYFVDRGTFTRMIDAGEFVEWARVYDNLYGTSYAGLQDMTRAGLDVVLDVDIQGGRNIRARFPESVLIFLVPPSLEVLEQRLRGRGTDSEEVIRARMETAMDDIRNCRWYDYIVLNDEIDRAIGETRSIIISSRCRAKKRLPEIRGLLGF